MRILYRIFSYASSINVKLKIQYIFMPRRAGLAVAQPFGEAGRSLQTDRRSRPGSPDRKTAESRARGNHRAGRFRAPRTSRVTDPGRRALRRRRSPGSPRAVSEDDQLFPDE